MLFALSFFPLLTHIRFCMKLKTEIFAQIWEAHIVFKVTCQIKTIVISLNLKPNIFSIVFIFNAIICGLCYWTMERRKKHQTLSWIFFSEVLSPGTDLGNVIQIKRFIWYPHFAVVYFSIGIAVLSISVVGFFWLAFLNVLGNGIWRTNISSDTKTTERTSNNFMHKYVWKSRI